MRLLLNSSLFLALALPAFAQAFRLSDPAFMAQYNASSAGSAPSAPTALPATEVKGHSFTANWSASAGATGYYVDAADTGFANYITNETLVILWNSLDVGNVTSTNIWSSAANMPNGLTWQYRVRAYNTFGTSGYSNVITTNTLNNADDPSISDAYDNGDCTIYIAWGWVHSVEPDYDVMFQLYDSTPTLISTVYSVPSATSRYVTVPGSGDYTITVTGRNADDNSANSAAPATTGTITVSCP